MIDNRSEEILPYSRLTVARKSRWMSRQLWLKSILDAGRGLHLAVLMQIPAVALVDRS